MTRPSPTTPLIAALLAGALCAAGASADAGTPAADHWPQWRGPLGIGVAPAADPPLTWGPGENVRWRVEIPGRGAASPVVWGDRVYLLTAVPLGADTGTEAKEPMRFELLALDRADGSVVWRRTAAERRPHEGTHPDGTWASASAITDGRRVFAYFGSIGLYAYSAAGEPLWQLDLGDMSTRRSFGEGSTPALHGDTLVVTWDHEGDSFIVALDAASGRERWRRERDEPTSWATPLVVEVDGTPQVVINATNRIRAYDLATGELVWHTGGMTLNTIPTPVHADGLLYATSGFRGNALKAIRLAGARGDLDGSDAIVWSYDQDTPYVPSPLVYRGVLYIVKHNKGILTALDAVTGELLYGPERLPEVEGVYASPVAAAGRVYIAGRDGTTVVLAAGRRFEVLAVNRLEEGFDASPALVGRELLLRGRRHLYCLAETGATRARQATSSAAREPGTNQRR